MVGRTELFDRRDVAPQDVRSGGDRSQRPWRERNSASARDRRSASHSTSDRIATRSSASRLPGFAARTRRERRVGSDEHAWCRGHTHDPRLVRGARHTASSIRWCARRPRRSLPALRAAATGALRRAAMDAPRHRVDGGRVRIDQADARAGLPRQRRSDRDTARRRRIRRSCSSRAPTSRTSCSPARCSAAGKLAFGSHSASAALAWSRSCSPRASCSR